MSNPIQRAWNVLNKGRRNPKQEAKIDAVMGEWYEVSRSAPAPTTLSCANRNALTVGHECTYRRKHKVASGGVEPDFVGAAGLIESPQNLVRNGIEQ
ncbi:MAG: hypothetical protein KGI86_14010 [Betaproteobacteria bacterium]|nr:hypothetical protein [Betaproteobacteria bacterium]